MNNLPWTLYNSWMNDADTKYWKQKLINLLNWNQPFVHVFGRKYLVPRKTIFLAENGVNYTYSGLSHCGSGWPEWFYPLLTRVDNSCSTNFNGCLLNLYRNGQDRMGWHSDDERELDSQKPIASFSIGASRDFYFKHRKDNVKQKLTLKNGDLLIMHPMCQNDWYHSIPSRKNINEMRINLTFRRYLTN